MERTKRRGERGSPCLRPLPPLKLSWSCPLIRILKNTKVMQAMVHCTKTGGNLSAASNSLIFGPIFLLPNEVIERITQVSRNFLCSGAKEFKKPRIYLGSIHVYEKVREGWGLRTLLHGTGQQLLSWYGL